MVVVGRGSWVYQGKTNTALALAGSWSLCQSLSISYFREDGRHRIIPVFLRLLRHGQYIAPIRCELSTEEKVHEVDLTNNINEVEEFTEEESEGVAVMVVPRVSEVVDQNLDPVMLYILLNDWQI